MWTWQKKKLKIQVPHTHTHGDMAARNADVVLGSQLRVAFIALAETMSFVPYCSTVLVSRSQQESTAGSGNWSVEEFKDDG